MENLIKQNENESKNYQKKLDKKYKENEEELRN
jgi:hypothetical protein